jgi:hypothetical protein
MQLPKKTSKKTNIRKINKLGAQPVPVAMSVRFGRERNLYYFQVLDYETLFRIEAMLIATGTDCAPS